MDRLTIGDVAKQANVRIETLRYYERQGSIGNSNGLFHGRPAPLAAVPLGRAPAPPRAPGRRGWRPPARLGLLGEDC